jgi:hypothetical protein
MLTIGSFIMSFVFRAIQSFIYLRDTQNTHSLSD